MKNHLRLITLASSTLIAASAYANNEKFDEIQKQLAIMSNVLKTTISQENEGNKPRIRAIETTYLAGQGAVMTVHSSGRGYNFGGFEFVMPDVDFSFGNAPQAPQAPVAPVVVDEDIVINGEGINEIISNAMDTASEAYERVVEEFSESREAYRELREKQRDLSYELRDLEREKRNLEYQARRNEKNKDEFKADIDRLQQQVEQLKQKKEKLALNAAEVKEKQKAASAKQAQIRNEYYKSLESQIAKGLCLYGNGLKALPKNENVSVILRQAGGKDGNRQKDKIIVFSKPMIKKCVVDDITSKELLANAKAYEF